ncbi:hypothetical protein GWO43_30570 [candidate division KSB1 bacterium]|nr:hypothetical protein [candidate division KSB1 bacterium]NIR72939.1 hypothetical protein [candidate division KSB1 bacterium]NIS28238.1 hypothetical protein [candidate division KSB1 bacterium]NIT75127.1 hypothetical protein [candidate division KSB1 bacterium]NIU28915.1 hypothetical protein [candidate division KSB1 bacterium]
MIVAEKQTPAPNTNMRIGEIAIVGPDLKTKKSFINAVCDDVIVETENLIFGRLQINDELVIHLYGVDLSEKELNPSWDLVSRKLLGYIVLFNWSNPNSLADVTSTVDLLAARYDIPLVIAANLKNSQTSVPRELLNAEINLTRQGQFTFCKLSDPKSVKNVLITLINSVLDNLN